MFLLSGLLSSLTFRGTLWALIAISLTRLYFYPSDFGFGSWLEISTIIISGIILLIKPMYYYTLILIDYLKERNS